MQTEPDIDASKFPPPPEWATYSDTRWGSTGKFRTHNKLGFAKNSLTQGGKGHLYHWDGFKWNWCASYPEQNSVKG